MTVNELIQQLQEIPDGLKNCDIIMRQYNDCCNDVISIDNVYVEVFCYDDELCYEDVTFEEAEKMDGYKSVILA